MYWEADATMRDPRPTFVVLALQAGGWGIDRYALQHR